MLVAKVLENAVRHRPQEGPLRGLCLLSAPQKGISGHAVAQCRAGDNGHIQEAGVADEPAQLDLLGQHFMEHGPVTAVAGVD